MKTLRGSLAAIALTGALAACGGDDDAGDDRPAVNKPTATPTAAPGDATGAPVVEMTDALEFEPQEIKVSVGDRVRWRNVGNIAHTVTTERSKVADSSLVGVPKGAEPWDSGLLGADAEFSRRFREPGTYKYVCIPHEGARMVGTIVVEG
jgi:plastocyanin